MTAASAIRAGCRPNANSPRSFGRPVNLAQGARDPGAEGQIWRHVGQGTFVGRHASAQQAGSGNLATASPKQLLDARLTLEPAIAASAAMVARASISRA